MNETVRRTKYMTQAAVATAITAILVLLKLLIPFLVFVTMIAGPAPIALITSRQGIRWGIGTYIASIILVTMLGGPEIGITTAVYAGVLGMALGYGVRKKWSRGQILCITALAYIVEMTYKIVVSIYVLGIADALSSIIERLVVFLQWIWKPMSFLLGYDPDPNKAVFSIAGICMLGVVFIINAFSYSYLAQELFMEIYKRFKIT